MAQVSAATGTRTGIPWACWVMLIHLDTDLGGDTADACDEQARLDLIHEGDLVRFRPGAAGRPTRVLADLDWGGFADHWLRAVEAAQRPA